VSKADRLYRRHSKEVLERLLRERGIPYTVPSSGCYKINGGVYHYWSKGYAKSGWHYYESHTAFLDSL
jgi:hypothetical protein